MALALSLAGLLCEPLRARANTQPCRANHTSPDVIVRVYGVPALSSWMLRSAETEATRVLRSTCINFHWQDCGAHVPSEPCGVPAPPTELIIRFLGKSLEQAGTSALGIAGLADGSSVAFIFYDRIVATRSHTRVIPVVLGRVMAHEITHLLLPEEHHSQLGLMRGQWSAEDLRITSSTSFALPGRSVLLMQKEATRRAVPHLNVAGK